MLATIYSAIKAFFRTIYLVIVTLPRDLKGLFIMRRIESKLDDHEKKEHTIPKLFYKQFKRDPKKSCIIFEGKTWTFEDVRLKIKIKIIFKLLIFFLGRKVFKSSCAFV